MIAWGLTLVAVILTIELLRALKLFRAFGELGREGRRALRIVSRTDVSEWAKERAMQLMSLRLFGRSFYALALLIVVGAPVILALWLLHPPGGWLSRIALLAVTIPYTAARRKWLKLRDPEAVLERLTLGSPMMREMSFDMERATHRAVLDAPVPEAPVFVTGLARAGTTILMRALHESGRFASLTYRDLPLPLAPNLWARLSQGATRSVETRERGHGDGIFHDLDSPEAIEEVFWLNAYRDSYRQDDRLIAAPVPDDRIDAFIDYVSLVQHRYRRRRYLSKNNNNVLRLGALVEAFPDAVLIHPFRDPLQQAQSLLRQHENACTLAKDDPRRRDFMTWMGHHEFGGDHRPFVFGDTQPIGDPTTIDYWLARWIEAYEHLLDQPETVAARQCFIDFDWLAADRTLVGAGLAARLGLSAPLSLATIGQAPVRQVSGAGDLLLARAQRVHTALQARYARDFGGDPSATALESRDLPLLSIVRERNDHIGR